MPRTYPFIVQLWGPNFFDGTASSDQGYERAKTLPEAKRIAKEELKRSGITTCTIMKIVSEIRKRRTS